jgi:TetR/AcrR family transcriptional regulator
MVEALSEPRPEPADVRERILEEATRRFAARGYDGTSVQEIADAVGIRKPSLLYHFPSKEELRQSVLEQVLAHWNGVLPRLLLAATSSHGQFDGVLGEMVAFFGADPDRARLLLREALDRPAEVRELMRRHVRPWIEATASFIRKGQERGRLYPEVDAEAYVGQVIALLIGSISIHEVLGTADRDRSLQELVRVAKSSLFRPEE